jgi:ABC-type glycerol-3-phosphate transport system permease component
MLLRRLTFYSLATLAAIPVGGAIGWLSSLGGNAAIRWAALPPLTPWINLTAAIVAVTAATALFAFIIAPVSHDRFSTRLGRAFIYESLCVWCLLVLFPLGWLYSTSAKPTSEVFARPLSLPQLQYTVRASQEELAQHPGGSKTISLSQAVKTNYGKALFEMRFARQFANSIFVVSLSLICILMLSAMAAYALARFKFLGSKTLFLLILAGLMLPVQLSLLPLFFEFRVFSEVGTWLLSPVFHLLNLNYEVNLFDNLFGLIFIYTGSALPFSIVVLVGFFRTLPAGLREAAIIDGATEWQTFWHVMLPLAKPGIATVAIFNFLALWNEYLYALTFLNSDELKTIPLGLANIAIVAQYKVDYGMLFAGLALLTTPTIFIYLLLQKRLTRGITMGAIKG